LPIAIFHTVAYCQMTRVFRQFRVGRFCPVCLRVYRDSEDDLPMICCDACDRWVHTGGARACVAAWLAGRLSQARYPLLLPVAYVSLILFHPHPRAASRRIPPVQNARGLMTTDTRKFQTPMKCELPPYAGPAPRFTQCLSSAATLAHTPNIRSSQVPLPAMPRCHARAIRRLPQA